MQILRHQLAELPFGEIEPLVRTSFFASPGFLNLWKVRGGTPVVWLVRIDGAVAAVLPGVEFGRGFLKRFHSTPNGCYGKLCLADGVDLRIQKEIADRILKAVGKSGYIKTFVNDYYGCFGNCSGFDTKMFETRLVDISDPQWEPPTKQVRKDIRVAERENVILERFDGVKHMSGFLTLVRLTEKRLRTKHKYPEEFYRALADLSEKDDRIQWVWCAHENRPVASSIFLVEGDNLLSWQIHYDSSLSHLQATKLARFVTARKAATEGVRYLNMGVSHEGAEGTDSFKRRWGGEMRSYRCYSARSLLGRLL
jgi:hypothetical protein